MINPDFLSLFMSLYVLEALSGTFPWGNSVSVRETSKIFAEFNISVAMDTDNGVDGHTETIFIHVFPCIQKVMMKLRLDDE